MASNDLTPMPDPDDMFADTRMSFGDHIEELRWHLWRAIIGFVAALVICLMPPIGPWAIKFITRPIELQLDKYFKKQEKQRPQLTPEQLKEIPAIATTIYVYRPALQKILAADKADVRILESLPDAADAVLRSLDVSPLAANPADNPDWAPLPVQVPDPTQLSRTLNEIHGREHPRKLTTLNVQEAFIVYVKVALLVGFVFSSPWVFYQLWSFVAVGLYPSEKKLVNHYLPISIALFFAGVLLCEFFALPAAIEGLLWFNEWLDFDPELRLNEWLGFAIIMPLVFGLSFQTPVVMLFLFKIGVVPIDVFRSVRRISYFVMAVFAALITPSTDIPTMMMLWIPMCLLYEVGIWLCLLQPASPIDDMDDSELNEMVGV